MQKARCLVIAFAVAALPLSAQKAQVGEPVKDFTFPDFANGDGRQKLSEFRGQPVLVVTFADVWGGTAASDRAIKLHEQHGDDGLVVILTHVASGGTFADSASGVDLAAWQMRRHPGADVRLCDTLKHPPWSWAGLGMPPYYAVIGADGELVGIGNVQRGTKPLEEAVGQAMKLFLRGAGEVGAVRALMHGKTRFADAYAKASGDLRDEVDAVFARRLGAVAWLLADGQWCRAKAEFDPLAAAAKQVADWQQDVDEVAAKFADAGAERELELDGQLERLLRPLAKKAPDANLAKRLREFAEQHAGSPVGARAARLCGVVEQAIAIK